MASGLPIRPVPYGGPRTWKYRTIRIATRQKLCQGRAPLLSKDIWAVRMRECRARMRSLIDPRICAMCKYAFISRGGWNTCSPCLCSAVQAYYREIGYNRSWRRIPALGEALGWAERERLIDKNKSTVPFFPIPDLDSERVQSAIRATLGRMVESVRAGRWIEDAMPRISPPLLPYPDVPRAILRRRGRFKNL